MDTYKQAFTRDGVKGILVKNKGGVSWVFIVPQLWKGCAVCVVGNKWKGCVWGGNKWKGCAVCVGGNKWKGCAVCVG